LGLNIFEFCLSSKLICRNFNAAILNPVRLFKEIIVLLKTLLFFLTIEELILEGIKFFNSSISGRSSNESII
jgi:hypothetical protein